MKYWDTELFPSMLATIRGEKYLLMTDSQIEDELNELAFRAISAFRYPKKSLEYSYEEDTSTGRKRYYFVSDEIAYNEIAIILAWMKYFWCDFIISNTDNFQNIYFDSNITSYSPGNTLHNYIKAATHYKDMAKELEQNYYRVDDGKPAIGGTIDDD